MGHGAGHVQRGVGHMGRVAWLRWGPGPGSLPGCGHLKAQWGWEMCPRQGSRAALPAGLGHPLAVPCHVACPRAAQSVAAALVGQASE